MAAELSMESGTLGLHLEHQITIYHVCTSRWCEITWIECLRFQDVQIRTKYGCQKLG